MATFADADITHSPADVSNTAAGIANCGRIGTTYTYLCDNTGQALNAGDTITIAALSVDAVTSAAVKPKIAVTTGTGPTPDARRVRSFGIYTVLPRRS